MSETRRSFLSMSLGSAAALGMGVVAFGLFRAFSSDTQTPRQQIDLSDLDVGTLTDLTVGARRAVVFNDADEGLKAYFITCTRAGCDLSFTEVAEGTPPIWRCTCDGSTFAMTGEALTGPAIHPLHRVAVRFDGTVMRIPPALGQVTRL